MTTERGSYSDNGGERLQEAASGVADRVADTAQQTVGTQVDTGMVKASAVLEQIAGAVRTSGDELRGDQPQVASFADSAAGQVERFARYLNENSAQDLMREAEEFARRQPAIFLGGAFALGLVASRFLKASPTGGSSGSRYRGYSSTGRRDRSAGGSYPSDYAGAVGYARDRGNTGVGYSSSTTPGYASGQGYAGAAAGTASAGTPVMSGTPTARRAGAADSAANETGAEHGGA